MERIDIKDFKAISRFTIIEGIFKKAEKALEGKVVEFYNLDAETKEKILRDKEIAKDDDFDFIYKTIPIFSNVDMTIDKKEFQKMWDAPSIQFANFIDLFMENFKEVFMTAVTLHNMENKMVDFIKDNEIEIPVEVVKSKEEVLDELYKEIESCTDRVKIKEIMAKINELEKETEVDEDYDEDEDYEDD